jgi:hypothetical protein
MRKGENGASLGASWTELVTQPSHFLSEAAGHAPNLNLNLNAMFSQSIVC